MRFTTSACPQETKSNSLTNNHSAGQKVDKLYSDSNRLFSELYHTPDEKEGYRRLTDFADPTAGGHPGSKERFFLPINFWFTRASGLALPLVALQ